MKWAVNFLPEALDDLASLNKDVQTAVSKAIDKVSENPLPVTENGYGKPLGKRNSSNLKGFLKIKLLKYGVRVVYKIVRTETSMLIIIIGARKDSQVYKLAGKRIDKYRL